MNRRAQKAITFRSDRAAARLALLTRGGKSQAAVIEEALDSVALPREFRDIEDRRQRILDAIARIRDQPRQFRTMAEFDAHEYDENGNPR